MLADVIVIAVDTVAAVISIVTAYRPPNSAVFAVVSAEVSLVDDSRLLNTVVV